MSCASTKTEERNAQNEYTGFQHLGLTLRGSHSPPRRLRLESLECKQAPAERQLRPGWTVRGGAGGGRPCMDSWPSSCFRETWELGLWAIMASACTHIDPDRRGPLGGRLGTGGACRGRGSLFLSPSFWLILFSKQIVHRSLHFSPRYHLPK